MPYDPEDDEEDDVTGAFVRGPANVNADGGVASWFGAPRDDASDIDGSGGRPVIGAVPAQPNAASAASVGKPSGSADDQGLQPIPYNPPSRPGSLDQAQSRLTQDNQNWEKFSQPLNRADYKPSVGRRIAGALAGAMVAAGSRNPSVGYNIARNVVDAPYDRAQDAQQQSANAAGQQLSNDRSDYQQQDRDYENRLQQYNNGYNAQNLNQDRAARARAAVAQEQQRLQSIAPGTSQPDDPANPMGSWHAVTVGGKQVKMSGPPAEWLKTPKGTDAQRDYEATRLGLTGNDRKFYLANGKLREPAPTTNIRNVPEGKAEFDAYVHSLGHPPTTQEILNWKHGAGRGGANQNGGMSQSTRDRIESQKNTAVNKAREMYGSGDNADYTFDDYMDDWQAAQNNYEDRIATQTGQEVPHLNVRDHVDAKGNWISGKPAQSPGTSGAQTQPGNAAPQAQSGVVKVELPNGKIGTIPAKNLKAALARGAKQVQ